MKTRFERSSDPHRRAFLSHTAKALLGVGLVPVIDKAIGESQAFAAPAARSGTARNVIYLYMGGGMSHLDTFDPKPGAETQGPVEAIKTSADGVLVSEHFPNTARHMDKVAVISGISSTQGAHTQGRYFMHTSYVLRGTIRHPHLGAWLTRMDGKNNTTLPGFVQVGGGNNGLGAGFFESKYAALPIGNPTAGLQHSHRAKNVSEERFDKRLERVARMNETFHARFNQKKVRAYADLYDEAVKLMNSRDLLAFDISKEPAELRAAYGNNAFGQGCLLARRLIEHQVRYVEVNYGGWDTHTDNFERVAEKSVVLDQALAALLGDMTSRGLLDETLLVLATEFGRTPTIVPGRNGRNHYPKAFTCLLAGGGVRGGQRHGRTDKEGREVIENEIKVPDFNATIAYALGLPIDQIVHSPSGRPFTIAHKGKPATEIF